jgi:hypothetical protein
VAGALTHGSYIYTVGHKQTGSRRRDRRRFSQWLQDIDGSRGDAHRFRHEISEVYYSSATRNLKNGSSVIWFCLFVSDCRPFELLIQHARHGQSLREFQPNTTLYRIPSSVTFIHPCGNPDFQVIN